MTIVSSLAKAFSGRKGIVRIASYLNWGRILVNFLSSLIDTRSFSIIRKLFARSLTAITICTLE
jgi:hypothetical protein